MLPYLNEWTGVYHSLIPMIALNICGALRDLVPFVQFKKR